MKKSLWLTLAVAAVAALFVVAGCAPAPPPDPTPDVTPTPAPTPAVDECPTDWTTAVQQIYICEEEGEKGNFALRITFNKEIFLPNLAALTDPDNWILTISRRVPFEWFDESTWWNKTYTKVFRLADDEINIYEVAVENANRTIVVKMSVPDNGGTSEPFDVVTDPFFWCLICTSADYNAWISAADDAMTGDQRIRGVADRFADVITWQLKPNVLVYDALGNPCYDLCGIGDEICCAFEPCPPVDAPCPI